MAFGTFFELMSNPRGIAAAVDAKNMPPAYFLNEPTVLQELINYFLYTKALLRQSFLFYNCKCVIL